MAQHLFYSGSYLFALLAQRDQFGAHGVELFLALVQLLAQARGGPFGGGLGLARDLQQFDGAKNLFFQRLKIGVGGDGGGFNCIRLA